MQKKYIRWGMVIAWAIVIFIFSCQGPETSNNNNKFIILIMESIGVKLDINKGLDINFIIRKLSHFMEFFILYYLLQRALSNGRYDRRSLRISLLITFLYACSDEIHQGFIPGRNPSFKDVIIDTGGGILCMCLKNLSKR